MKSTKALFGLTTLLLVAGPVVAGIPTSPGEVAGNGSSLKSISESRVFAEPLVARGAAPSPAEAEELARVIGRYLATKDQEDLSLFSSYLGRFPGNPWRVSILVGMGNSYRFHGYFTRAIEVWEEAWSVAQSSNDARAVNDASSAVGGLAELYARLGRMDRLNALLKEVEGQPLSAVAREQISAAAHGLWLMRNEPTRSFRCGPLGLAMLKASQGKPEPRLFEEDCTPEGTHLAHNERLARKYGLNLQMAKRNPGASVLAPALVHWKAGHFAALIRESNGRYLMQDPTFGQEYWVSKAALDAEASGYVLVANHPLPPGWRGVEEAEGSTVWGRGALGVGNPGATTTDDHKPSPCPGNRNGMPSYNFHSSLVSLNITDTPIGYIPPRGPAVQFTITYNQREIFDWGGYLGPNWTCNWFASIEDDPVNAGGTVQWHVRGGGRRTLTGFDAQSQSYPAEKMSQAVLVRTSSASYELRFPDGSKEIYGLPDGAVTAPRQIRLTQVMDRFGNALTLAYDSAFRLQSITDALGQVTQLEYGLPADSRKITRVMDPFGRSALFEYESASSGGMALSKVTDSIGMSSTFVNERVPASQSVLVSASKVGLSNGKVGLSAPPVAADGPGSVQDMFSGFITSMTTPYGTTTFARGEDPANTGDRWVMATDPQGGREYLRMVPNSVGVGVGAVAPPGHVPQTMNLYTHLNHFNSFYWDKRAMAAYPDGLPTDFLKAHVLHWSMTAGGLTSNVLECEKKPLENWVWYTYQGQPTQYFEGTISKPTEIVRFLDDGSLQIQSTEYNAWGKPTKVVDPLGRATSYTYSADGMDLLEVRNSTAGGNEVLAKYTYDARHLPLSATDASGRSTSFTYNAAGQPSTITNPNGEATTFTYDPNGYLQQVQGPVTGATTTFTYDSVGRLTGSTGPDGLTVTHEYDNLDRRTRTTFPDGTYEETSYDKLDVGRTRDRMGRWTLLTHNALRQLVEVQDPEGRITKLGWCGCGSQLESLTDPMGRVTSWFRDLQGRVVGKAYPDGKMTTYNYDGLGKLNRRIDAKGQETHYAYHLDGNLREVRYEKAERPTPSVSYGYDPRFNRLTSMVDGQGTTTYSYYPIQNPPALGAGRLAMTDGPLPNDDLTYTYDALGRIAGRSIHGVSELRSFDAMGRLVTVSNPLGTFTYTYDGATNRLIRMDYPNGQQTNFSYLPSTGLLGAIQNRRSDGSNISAFGYTYDASGQIATWSQQADAQAPKTYTFQYDAVGQLLSAVLKGSSGELLHQYDYGYDQAGNRTSETVDGSVTSATFNSINQLVGQGYAVNPAFGVAKLASKVPRRAQSAKGAGRPALKAAKPSKAISVKR